MRENKQNTTTASRSSPPPLSLPPGEVPHNTNTRQCHLCALCIGIWHRRRSGSASWLAARLSHVFIFLLLFHVLPSQIISLALSPSLSSFFLPSILSLCVCEGSFRPCVSHDSSEVEISHIRGKSPMYDREQHNVSFMRSEAKRWRC